MSIEGLKDLLPETAKDIRLNLSKVLSEEGAPGLTPKQIMGTALACAYATRMPQLIEAVREEAGATLFAGRKRGIPSGGHHHGDEQHLLPLHPSGGR